MTYEFVLPGHVEELIDECASYIGQDSPGRAVTWVDEVVGRMKALVEAPRAHPIAEDESRVLGREVRKLTLGNYLAFYTVDDRSNQIIVVAFRHGARQSR